jgi:hypothetical protein
MNRAVGQTIGFCRLSQWARGRRNFTKKSRGPDLRWGRLQPAKSPLKPATRNGISHQFLSFVCLFLLGLGMFPAARAAGPMLFVYFKEPANMGVFFAISDDGYHFHPLNGGKPWFGIEHAGALIRDPFIARGSDGQFHMVWTWGWRGQSIGYAHSADLVHWSEQRELPLMAGIPGTNNTWAPETYWDEAKSQWLIVWSSTVAGRQQGNRIYSAWTADFRTFSKPEVFFDPGYVVIDATMIHTRGRYYLVFKDERQEPLHREIKIADGPSIQGPWGNISEPITESWSEGPSIQQVGNDYLVYYDHYHEPWRYEAVRSSDMKQWTPINGETSFPDACKHGSFLKITEQERQRLESSLEHSLPDLYREEEHGDPPYLSESGWRPLLNGRDLAGWHPAKPNADAWFTAAGVNWERTLSPLRLTARAGAGGRIVNGPEGHAADLIADEKSGSFELYLEFLLAKSSSAGVFLHGLYEIRIADSFAYDGPLTIGDCGAIFEMPEGRGGAPPERNAARAAGEWQSLRIWFQAPRFDAAGKKAQNAKVLRVMLNGIPVQENIVLEGGATGHLDLREAARNPLMLRGNAGAVAFRNLYLKELE